jgi:hypothetical protein
LLGTIGRTAVVAGTASATVNAVNRRSQQRDIEQQQAAAAQPPPPAPTAEPAPAAPSPPAAGEDIFAQLKQLGELRDSHVIDAAEFETLKAKILASA